jgi:hypothetical protein
MARYHLYQRDDCHLCDQALALLAQVRFAEPRSVFIDGDAALEARYGLRVPVLRDTLTGREIDWPFDAAQLRALAAGERGDPEAGATPA